MKRATVIGFYIIIVLAFFLMAGCRKQSEETEATMERTTAQTAVTESEETTEAVETTAVTETTEVLQEMLEVTVIESTPDSVKIELKDKDSNKTAQAEIGVQESGGHSEDLDNTPAPTNPKPTEPKPTEPKPTEPKPTEPKPTEPKPTESKTVQPSTGGTKVEAPGTGITYADYEAMSGQEQMLFYYSFADADSFYEWYNAAKAEYEAGRGDIAIGDDGVVNLG